MNIFGRDLQRINNFRVDYDFNGCFLDLQGIEVSDSQERGGSRGRGTLVDDVIVKRYAYQSYYEREEILEILGDKLLQ